MYSEEPNRIAAGVKWSVLKGLVHCTPLEQRPRCGRSRIVEPLRIRRYLWNAKKEMLFKLNRSSLINLELTILGNMFFSLSQMENYIQIDLTSYFHYDSGLL
jgi:hypothetical protein